MLAGPLVWAAMLVVGQGKQSGWPTLRVWFFVVLVAPLLEEFIFRGGLQAWLFEKPFFCRRPLLNISFANLLTSFIFAAFHVLSQPILWAASIFFPSLVFGWARDKTGSVLPAMLLHAWYNLGFVALFVR